MGWQAWFTLGVTVAMVLAMIRNVAGPDMILMAGLTALLAAGVLGPEEAFAGFSNPGMLTVGVLFVVAAGVRETGALDYLGRSMLGQPQSPGAAQMRMTLPVLLASAFLNNTPVVAMMVPLVQDWARRMSLSVSHLMMPLSFAAILGGTCTLIGTSTNLIVAGLATMDDPTLDLALFEISLVGLPAAILGLLYMLLWARWLLPDRRGVRAVLENAREYTVQMRVEPGSPVVGRTVEQAGLRHLPGLFLVQVHRDGDPLPGVGPHTVLHEEDLLLFVGVVESVVDLRKIRGLVPANDQVDLLMQPRADRRLVEAVLSAQSPMVGINVRDARFRTRYNAAIIAIHRQGVRVPDKIGDIVLEAGDTLLLEAPSAFTRLFGSDNNFALVSEVANSTPPRHERAWIAVLILTCMVAANVAGLLPLLTAALLAAAAMLVTRCISAQDARRSVDMRVMLAIAAAFGIGAALQESGAATAISAQLVTLARPFGDVGLVVGVYAATSVLSAVIANNAAAVLMYPIVASTAAAAGLPIKGFLYALMMAASLSFATPIAYQTNLMVYGPGGYRFADFLRFGLPLQVLLGALSCLLCWLLWF